MLSHYLAVALRSFARYRLHSALTVAVLSLGLICFIAAGLLVLHFSGFDRQFPHSDRIYVVYQQSEWPANGMFAALGPQSAMPVAEQLNLDIPELAGVARFLMSGSMVSLDGAEPTFRRVAYVDPDWLGMFDLDVVAGAANGALARPRTAIVTQEAATQLFGTAAAVGRILSMTEQGNRTEVTVAAVVADIPAPSHLANGQFSVSFEILVSWDVLDATYPMMNRVSWMFPSATTYVLLPADGSFSASALNNRLRSFGERPLSEVGAKVSFEARHVSRLTVDRLQMRIQGFQSGGSLPLELSTILLSLGALILGIACLNFINLTTARSAARAREVGVRKSLGAKARSVIYQDLLQTVLTVLIAIAVALAVISAIGHTLENRWRLVIDVPWSTPAFWLLFAGLLLVVTAIAGSYPATMLARIAPVSALRLGAMKGGPKLLRALLVSVQFASATFLIIAVTVVYLQTEALRKAALGRFDDPYVVLNPNLRAGGTVAFDVIASEIARGPGIKGVAGISSYPWQSSGGQQPLRRSRDEQSGAVMTEPRYVTHDYFSLMETPLLAGRWFSRDRADDGIPQSPEEAQGRSSPARIVIDHRTASDLGWPSPDAAIGELVYAGNNQQSWPLEVIGVVESLPLALRNRGNNGFIYWLAPRYAMTTLVRIAGGDIDATLEHIDGVAKGLAPGSRVFRQFLDESFEQAYWAFNVANRVVIGLAIFATVIASIGLFGMASFMTRRRTREIGLRKSQGATSTQILRLLLWDFSKPVLVANIVVWPLAYLAARAYLDLFIERMTLTPLPFVATLVATLLIAWIVVGVHVVRAARLNPTIALRHE